MSPWTTVSSSYQSRLQNATGTAPESPFPPPNEVLEDNKFRIWLNGDFINGGYKWVFRSLQAWSGCPGPSLLVIDQQDFVYREELRELSTDLVGALKQNNKPVAWILQPKDVDEMTKRTPNTIDVLRYLIQQLIQLPLFYFSPEVSVFVNAIFKSSASEEEGFHCLRVVLNHSAEVFIVIEATAGPTLPSVSWPVRILEIFNSFKPAHVSGPKNVKVAFIGSAIVHHIPEDLKSRWEKQLIIAQPPPLLPADFQKKSTEYGDIAKERLYHQRAQLAEVVTQPYHTTLPVSFDQHFEGPPYERPFTERDEGERSRLALRLGLNNNERRIPMASSSQSSIWSSPFSTGSPYHGASQNYTSPGNFQEESSEYFLSPPISQSFDQLEPTSESFRFPPISPQRSDNNQRARIPNLVNKQEATSARRSTLSRSDPAPPPPPSKGSVRSKLEESGQSAATHEQYKNTSKPTSTFNRPRDRNGFEIALICALRVEFDSVEALFDEYYEDDFSFGKSAGDPNAYTTGRIHGHNVVLAFMPGMGKASSASLAASFRASFTGIKVGLVVGVCGGVPYGTDDEKEIILGDVIISTGIVQFDFGRLFPDRAIPKNTLEDNLGRPNVEIRSYLAKLSSSRSRRLLIDKTSSYLTELCARSDFREYQYPGVGSDCLFRPEYRHKHQDALVCTVCAACDSLKGEVCSTARVSTCEQLGCQDTKLVPRVRLSMDSSEPRKPLVHFGRIASGDLVMKSGHDRDQIAAETNVIAFEMEGAGVWDVFPTVVIKGVCDYSDSHKNKQWQKHAAVSAACCMKAFLYFWRRSD